MTQPAKVQEPSMEEILASIRRIIADDEAKPPVAEAKPAAVEKLAASPLPAKAEKPPAPAPAPKPVMNDIPPSKVAPSPKAAAPTPPPAPPPPAPPPAASASNSQDDIDALLNGLDEATTEEEIRPAPVQPEAEAEVFELTDDMAVPSAPPPSQPAFQKVEPEDDIEFAESAASRAINRPPAYEPPAFDPPAPPQAAILSQSTVSAVESAFNTLAHTVLSNNARTLEDLVKEMLRPMLKSWLDDNLPGLVERIVKAEIERVSRGR
jgi:cell pole-organizing protein PopZ